MDEDLVGNQIIRTSNLTPLGRALVRVGLLAQRRGSALRIVEWGGPSSWPGGNGMCPACGSFRANGHADSCAIAGALRPHDSITHAEEAIRYVRGLVMDQEHAIQRTLVELHSTLDEVARILGQL